MFTDFWGMVYKKADGNSKQKGKFYKKKFDIYLYRVLVHSFGRTFCSFYVNKVFFRKMKLNLGWLFVLS